MKVAVKKQNIQPIGRDSSPTGKRGIRVLWESLCVAFSMYSILPMPRVVWNKKSLRYTFCFFPLIGVLVGGALFLWARFCIAMELRYLFAAVAAAIPILLSGGIHLDGFCDVMDAIGSHGTPEVRLKIMKDSYSGAFAVMGCGLYLLVSFALWMEYFDRPSSGIFFSYILSRSFSALAVTQFPCAKSSGLASAFSNAADTKQVRLVLIVYVVLCGAGMFVLSPVGGTLCLLLCGCVLLFFRDWVIRRFGGVTGDLAGWLLCICELASLCVFAVTGGIL